MGGAKGTKVQKFAWISKCYVHFVRTFRRYFLTHFPQCLGGGSAMKSGGNGMAHNSMDSGGGGAAGSGGGAEDDDDTAYVSWAYY